MVPSAFSRRAPRGAALTLGSLVALLWAGCNSSAAPTASGPSSASGAASGNASIGGSGANGGNGGSGNANDTGGTGATGGNTPSPPSGVETVVEIGVQSVGPLVLAHGAFWFGGAADKNGERVVGAIRLPLNDLTSPRVLEGNNPRGPVVASGSRVYRGDTSGGQYLTVHEANGDLVKRYDVAAGEPTSDRLGALSVNGSFASLAVPSCQTIYLVNLETDEILRTDTDATYRGGVTNTLIHGDYVYCVGNDYIYQVSLTDLSIVKSWKAPELGSGYEVDHRGYLWKTTAGLLTWRNSTENDKLFELLSSDAEGLTLTPFGDATTSVGAPEYERETETVLFFDLKNELRLTAFSVKNKAVSALMDGPLGGTHRSGVTWDTTHLYWMEERIDDADDHHMYIVRYPRPAAQ